MEALEVKNIYNTLVDQTPKQQSVALYRKSIFNILNYSDLDDSAKCEISCCFILESCPYIGSVTSNGDASFFLKNVVDEISHWPKSGQFADRRIEHLIYALSIESNSLAFTSSPAALASIFLLHQLEFFFRALSAHLNIDGTFKDIAAKSYVEATFSETFGSRVNDISWTYNIMCLNKTNSAVDHFINLDKQLPQSQVANGDVLSNIGERLAYIRHRVSHGPLADPSSEGLFYALLVTLIIFGSNLFQKA